MMNLHIDEETELRVIIVLAQVTASDRFGTLIPDLFHSKPKLSLQYHTASGR